MTARRPTVKRIGTRKLALRNKLWPDLDEGQIWIRTKSKGFTTVPRSMTCILQIMDKLSPGKPLGSTYFTLWCHVFDECFVVINNPRLMAFEAGFRGQRSESTWKVRMKKLLELGFIDAKEGGGGPFTNILIYNPYLVIRELKDSGQKLPEDIYNFLIQKMSDIGADDF